MDSNSYPFAEVEAKWQRLWEEGRESARHAGSSVEPRPSGLEAAAAAPRHLIYTSPEPLGRLSVPGPRGGRGAGLPPLAGSSPGSTATLSPAAERTAVTEPLVEESAELAAARLRVCADTLARYERHRGRAPRVALPADGFAPEIVAGSLARGTTPEAVLARCVEGLSALERSLGLPGGERLLTSDPRLYRFTQWIFLQLLARKLAYRAERVCSACSRCGGRYRRGLEGPCPRCRGSLAERKLSEWRLDLTPYGERLIAELDRGDWTAAERALQRGVLGRRRGCEVSFPVSRPFEIEYQELIVFTTRIETIFGATFILLHPYHPLLDQVVDTAYEDEVARYRERLRKGAEPEISAARTGGFALNPANLRRIPILASPLADDPWGGGALMGVPGHDATLFELAKRLKLPIREVIHGEGAKLDSQARLEEPWLGDGVLTNSGPFTSLAAKTGRERLITFLGRKGVCHRATRYRFRSMPLSSPSPWGPPVPLIRCKRCGLLPVAEGELPVELPPLTPEILARGEGALAALKDFRRVRCPQCGEGAEREAETLVPWLGNALSLLAAAIPELAGQVEGFRDLSAPGGGRPAAPAGTAGVPPPSGAPEREMVPARPAPGPGGAEAAENGAGGGDQNLLPEDVDIFEVPPGGNADGFASGDGENGEGLLAENPVAPRPAATDPAGVDPGDPAWGGPELAPPADPGADAAPAPQGSSPAAAREEPGGEAAAANAPREPGREERRGRDRRRRGRGEADGKQQARTPGKVEGKPAADEEEGKPGRPSRRGAEEPETIVPELAEDDAAEGEEGPFTVSSLRPFAGAATGGLPAASALGTASLGAREQIGLRLLIKFLGDLGFLPFEEPFRLYRSVERVLTAGEARRGPRAGELPPASGEPAPAGKRPVLEGEGGAPAEDPMSVAGLVRTFGADAVRLQMLFGGPPGRPLCLRARGVRNMGRLLDRVWRQVTLRIERGKFVSRRMLVEKHGLIDKVTRRLAALKFHTAVAAIMSFVRFLEHPETAPEDMDREAMKTLLILLSPFAPHLAAELWARMGSGDAIDSAPWPVASEELIHPAERDFPIMVDGRIRDRMQQPASLESEKLESRALQREKIREIVGSRHVDKVIVVPGKLVSVVLAPER